VLCWSGCLLPFLAQWIWAIVLFSRWGGTQSHQGRRNVWFGNLTTSHATARLLLYQAGCLTWPKEILQTGPQQISPICHAVALGGVVMQTNQDHLHIVGSW
jgi:hypothetical protein